MSVLVEGISIIIKREAIEQRTPGGWEGFLNIVPNLTLCFDDHLARVGFMGPPDVEQFSSVLRAHGLRFVENDQFVDFAIVDQIEGPTLPCTWLEFFRLTLFHPHIDVAACKLKGTSDGDNADDLGVKLAIPPGWDYEESLSKDFNFTLTENMNKELRFLRSEGNVDVYLNLKTGKETYIGRTNTPD